MGIGGGDLEFEGDFLPAGGFGGKTEARQDSAGGVFHLQGEFRRALLRIDPEGAVVRPVGLEVDAVLANADGAALGCEADALFALLESDRDQVHGAAVLDGLPVVFEVIGFESLAADLFRIKAVNDGVVDVLEELAVDVFVDLAGGVIRVDEENRHTRRCCGGGIRGPGDGRDKQRRKERGDAPQVVIRRAIHSHDPLHAGFPYGGQ